MRVWLVMLFLFVAMIARAQDNIALPAEVYETPGPHVVVNGKVLKAPVKEVNGSLLLPMRAVFEALEAKVSWFPALQQINATRGTTTVQLQIARPSALVNEQVVQLAAPPVLIDGATYVPLRFPAEAFGGEVKWLGAVRTAVITITPLTVATPPPPTPPPAAGPQLLEGVLAIKVTAGVTALQVQDLKGDTSLVQVLPNATITRANGKQAPQPATFADLEPGDQLQVTRDAAGRATAIVARYARLEGVVAAIANNKLLMQDGALYQLQADIRVVDTTGQAVPLARAGVNGTKVTLDLTPETTNVWRVTVPPLPVTPPPAAVVRAPGILTVAAVGYTRALKAGDVLTIQVTGEPKADKVTASVGDILRDLELTETGPGTYTRKVTIAPVTNITQARITAVMRLNGENTAPVESVNPITIDTRPPSFDALFPEDGSQFEERNPTIQAAFADPGGSGVDARSVKITVNGEDVTPQATVTDARISYKAQMIALGKTTVRVTLTDLAGNAASAQWTMTVTQPVAAVAQMLTHDATAPLMAGKALKLVGKFTAAPVKLEWFLGSKRISTAMNRDDATGEYRISYTILATDALGEQRVSVRYYSAADASQVVFAPTPVTLVVRPITFAIASPADKSKAPVPLIVTGKATPGTQVRVTVTYSTQVAILEMKGELYKAVLTADVQGNWKTTEIGTEGLLKQPDTYTVLAEQLDADGKAKKTLTIGLTRK